MRRTIPAALAALPLLAAGTAATAQDGPARAELVAQGRRVAETWCANCHLVGSGEPRGPAGDAAPPFPAIARMPSTTEMALRAFLQTPHARMPDYRLSTAELDGVVAYILSLKGGR
jgi:mono/diheme cytochrome c family protein